MNRFAETLREIDERLDLPQPAKSRILLEIAADLNEAFDYLVEKIVLLLLVVAGSGTEIYSSRLFTQASPLVYLPIGAGLAESFTTTILGLTILIVSAVAWIVLRGRYESLTRRNRRELSGRG